MRRTVSICCVMLAAFASAATAAPEELAKLDEALKAVATLEYGRDNGSLEQVSAAVVAAAKDPKRRGEVEQRLLRALGSASTRDARSFLCRQLRTIGTARSVGPLEKLLTDAELSHMARYALGRIESPAAAAALHRALPKTSGKVQAGIVNTLANRRYAQATDDFVRLLGSSDTTVAAAAARALGQLGGAKAVEALELARPKSTGRLRRCVDDALLRCAEHYLHAGSKADAAGIYEAFFSPKEAKHLRLGALRGLVAARGAAAAGMLVAAIKGDDAELRASAIGFMAMAEGQEATKAFVALLPSLSPDGKVLVLRALDSRGDKSAAPAIVAATKSKDEAVRVAALNALGGVGDASTVAMLVEAAASAGGTPQQAARASLVRLEGADVDRALIRSAGAGEAKVRVEAIRALAARGAAAALAAVLKAARDDDAAVRREAIRALGVLAGEKDIGSLVALAVRPREASDRSAVERAIAAALMQVADRDRRADVILAGLAGAPVAAKPALVRLLGIAGSAKALDAVRVALEDTDAAVKDAAVRTISAWPDASAAEDLLAVARGSSSEVHKVLLLRGYVRMAGTSKDPTSMYVRAMKLAERPADKKLVLAGLGTAGSNDALQLVEKYLADPRLAAEAALAAVQIADRLRQNDAARARAVLKRVLAVVKDERVRRRAADVYGELDKFEGYLLAWMVTGPYQQKGKDGQGVFDMPFPPEKPDAKDVKWKRLARGVGSWNIDLENMLGSLDHCAAYVRTRVWSPAEQEARLEMGSDDALKAWLNGRSVHAKYQNRGIEPRQDVVDVKLRKGWNELLLKVVDYEGGWAFCCRVRGRDGAALDGLKVEAK